MRKITSGKMEPKSTRRGSRIPRRDFLKYLGGGILILFNPLAGCNLKSNAPVQDNQSLPKDFNAFLHIAEDGSVTCFTGKIEMGQGPVTALAQMMADELDVSYESVKMVMGDTDLCPWDGGTWGSLCIREFGPSMRAAAAEARSVLLQLASEQLHVPVGQLEVRQGIITDKQDKSKTISYAQLTRGKKIERHVKGDVILKDPSKFNIIGKSYLRHDAHEKVTGKAEFSGDIKLTGMLHARIVRPPSHGAKLKSADTSEAEKITGIQVVRDGDFIALLHKDRDKVDEAIVKVKAEYTFDEMKVNDKTIYEHYQKFASKGNVVNEKGDIKTGRQISDKVIESEFHHSYVAHSPIEPHTAAAMIEGDKITVWASAQTPFPTREAIAAKLGLPLNKVRVITPFVGGGFGGKADNPQAVEVARITKMTGRPVMLAYTREEEFFYDTTRSAALIKLASGMDKTGKITFWDYNVYCAGDRGSDTIYDVPHQRTTSYDQGENDPPVHPFATGPWRAPGNSNNTFAREMQICLMASRAGMDPLDFRLKNLKDDKMVDVLKAAADKFGYTPSRSPSGRGYGIACGTDVDTWVAVIAEVKVDKKSGHVQVIRVACAQDMGLCVNPQGATLQMEGCITMGLGYSFTEELLFEGGKMFNKNYDTYEIPRFSWVPKIDTVILQKTDQPPHGGGEPAVITMGGVIASGIFDATGAVLYDMPMTPARVLEALKKV
jgi:nicotinate dehydrogenase subunit B